MMESVSELRLNVESLEFHRERAMREMEDAAAMPWSFHASCAYRVKAQIYDAVVEQLARERGKLIRASFLSEST